MILSVFLVLSAWGVKTSALLASAGILGLAISFGAQSLIADMLSGLFIIFEHQFAEVMLLRWMVIVVRF